MTGPFRRLARRSTRIVRRATNFRQTSGRSAAIPRLSSFPLISGDTFMLACDRVLNDEWPDPTSPARSGGAEGRIAFVELSRIETAPDRERLLEIGQQAHEFSTLVLHNGDFRPDPDYLDELARLFRRVYAVNVVDETERVRALPIGLQNFSFGGTTLLDSHLSAWAASTNGARRRVDQALPIMVSFRCATNREQREALAQHCGRRGLPNQEMSNADFFATLDRSLFVLSPPGNGPDCHRTWEAIYHGAVPVVLRGHLAPTFTDQLPILVVDDWAEVLDRSTSELQNLYEGLIDRPRHLASMQYWVEAIRRSAK